MSPKPDLDAFLAKEGWYEVEGAGEPQRIDESRSSVSVAPASSCSHSIWDRVDICRGCGISREVEEDVDG